MRRALYAFSGDPVTKGHLAIIERASHMYDELLVAIGNNAAKTYLFSQAERVEMAKSATATLKNVRVMGFTGLLVDFAWEQGATVIVRGLRNREDFEFEQTFSQLCMSQQLPLELVYLFARPELAHISSSAVKELQANQGLLQEYVPLVVKQRLEDRLSGQKLLGITGEIGAGKSYVAEHIAKLCQERREPCHIVELDDLGHEVLSGEALPQYLEVRREIISEFGEAVKNPDGTINRHELGGLVFSDAAQMKKLNEIMYQPLLVRLRHHLLGKKGLILIVAALTAEFGIAGLTNNHVVLVSRDPHTQRESLLARGLDEQQIDRRLASQWNTGEKRAKLQEAIAREGYGMLWEMENDSSEKVLTQLRDMLRHFGISD